MKRFIIIAICSLLLTSCEDVIDVDLNDSAPRLVVEANINKSIEDGSSIQSWIKLTTTAPFFDEQVPIVEDAHVKISDEDGDVYYFAHGGEGYYFGNLIPQENIEYTLEIIYDDEVYSASNKLTPTPPLEYVEQRDDGGFFGDQIELKVYFTDFPGEENFYFLSALSERGNRRDVIKDEFYEGNSIFGIFVADDLAAGDHVRFNLFGITEGYYNYMYILLQQTGSGGGPFETQPATVRGNVINQTNPENYPLGYFRISEVSILDYIVE